MREANLLSVLSSFLYFLPGIFVLIYPITDFSPSVSAETRTADLKIKQNPVCSKLKSNSVFTYFALETISCKFQMENGLKMFKLNPSVVYRYDFQKGWMDDGWMDEEWMDDGWMMMDGWTMGGWMSSGWPMGGWMSSGWVDG